MGPYRATLLLSTPGRKWPACDLSLASIPCLLASTVIQNQRKRISTFIRDRQTKEIVKSTIRKLDAIPEPECRRFIADTKQLCGFAGREQLAAQAVPVQ